MKLALLGNQNSGKTSLFNALTGSNQKVGNWPGVTIDRVEGIIKKQNSTIVDLPGVYSLSPYTSEEEISRRFVIDEKLDLIINIVDATQLERSLYLTTQLLELDVDVVVALNMYDLLKHKGIDINVKKLEEELGVTIIPISAKTGAGINRLKNVIFKRKYKRNKHQSIYPDDVENFIKQVESQYKYVKKSKNGKPHKRFGAVKILEDYLEAILVLEIEGKRLHSIDIAKHLGVSKPAVTRALKHLANLGYVTKASYSDVTFTTKGRNLAKKIYHRHTTIKKFLISIGIDEKIAEIDCCKIEHVISSETLSALSKLIKN